MDAKDLRIGNYVQLHDKHVQVLEIWDTALKTTSINTNCAYFIEQYKPVQLTEGVLLKCGFKRFPWGLSIDKLLFKDDNKCSYLELEVGNGFRVKVIYLHQLQNLYHSLTGKELVYNE